MKTFKDTQTGQHWQFDDDVVVEEDQGHDHDSGFTFTRRFFFAPNDLNTRLNVPETLEPAKMPEPEPYIEPPKTIFAAREFLAKFTMAEYAAARTHTNIGVQWALDNLIGAQFVDIEDPDTIAGLDLMVAEGVITPERRDELLTPQAAE